MVVYSQREFFSKDETGSKTIYPGVQASLLRLECTGGGTCTVFAKLYKESELTQLSGINASDFSPVNSFSQGLYSLEISGYQEVVINSTGGLMISVKTVY